MKASQIAGYGGNAIHIISGEGTGAGVREHFRGRHTVRAIAARLRKERCNGDRWARAVQYSYEGTAGPLGTNLETGAVETWYRLAYDADGE